jgi:hypothetical protein
MCVLQVHDMLVGEQGVDPSSPLYYTAIESHVAAAFPDKWAHWQQLLAAAGAQPCTPHHVHTSVVCGHKVHAHFLHESPGQLSVPQSPGLCGLGRVGTGLCCVQCRDLVVVSGSALLLSLCALLPLCWGG